MAEHRIEPYGCVMDLDANEYIDRSIRNNTFEPITRSWFEAVIRPGDVIADVGANIGFFSLIASKLTGPDGRVLAFEPTAYGMWKLKRNLTLNDVQNVICFKLALSTTERHAVDISYDPKGYYNEQDKGIRSSWHTADGAVGSAQLGTLDFADFVPLDTLVERYGWSRIDVLKIDVDGNELSVIEGARQCIRRDRPRMILELLDPGRSTSRYEGEGLERFQSLLTFLFETGYRATAEDGVACGTPASLLTYLRAFDGRRGAPNFLFQAEP